MTPQELRSIMTRTRVTSPMIAARLGIARPQITKWRNGIRPIPKRHLPIIEAMFREAAERLPPGPARERARAKLPPPRIDPRAMPKSPVATPPIAIGLRDDPPAAPATVSMVEVINGALGALFSVVPAPAHVNTAGSCGYNSFTYCAFCSHSLSVKNLSTITGCGALGQPPNEKTVIMTSTQFIRTPVDIASGRSGPRRLRSHWRRSGVHQRPACPESVMRHFGANRFFRR
jgi:hypothetical protein